MKKMTVLLTVSLFACAASAQGFYSESASSSTGLYNPAGVGAMSFDFGAVNPGGVSAASTENGADGYVGLYTGGYSGGASVMSMRAPDPDPDPSPAPTGQPLPGVLASLAIGAGVFGARRFRRK